MSGATASLPNLQPALDAATNAQTGLSSFMQVAGSLGSDDASSPLHAVRQAIGGVQGSLQIDLSGLSQRLPQAITTIENALPADALRFVENLNDGYQELSDFLTNGPLVKQIAAGNSLEQTALAIVETVLSQFAGRLTELGSSLIDADTLSKVTAALTTIEQLAGGQPPAAGDLVKFLANQLVGVEHDLLQAANTQLTSALQFLEPLSAPALEARIGNVRDAVASAFEQIDAAIENFDPSDAAAYPALEALLQTWADAVTAAFDVIAAACDALASVVGAPAWDSLFNGYTTALTAIPLADVPTVDDAIDAVAAVIESLLSRLRMNLSPEELAQQIEGVAATLHELFAQSPLPQVRQSLIDFIERIRGAIESVPTEEVQQAVSGMLQRIKQELDGLHIDQVRTQIAAGFQTAHDFIDENIGDDLLGGVSDVLDGALEQFDQIPIADIGQALAQVVQQAGELIQQLAGELSSALDDLRSLLSQLDGVDFRPLADEVIEEIDALKAKLAAIQPNALSDVEKIAIQAGLSILRALDLEGMIEGELKLGFAAIDRELTQVVQAVLDAWNHFRDRIVGFDGGAIAGPVNALLDQVSNAVNGVNGSLVLAPLDSLVEQLVAEADKLSPGALLEPLKAPYAQMMATINRANPDVWVEPLRLLHAEIDRLVNLIDITPLLDTLEEKERDLFRQAREGLAAALDSVHLPAPLDGFLDTMKALLLGLSDAVFADPDVALREFNVTLGSTVKPSTLFAPLDAAFDRLLAAIDQLPAGDVLSVLESLRQGLGLVLPALNPAGVMRTLRDAQSRLDTLKPGALSGVIELPALRESLEARLDLEAGHDAAKVSLRARFDLVLQPLALDVPQSSLQQLDASVRNLSDALRRRINGLDASGAQAAYTQLDAQLTRLLPAFLRQSQPLTANDVHASLATLRPSTKARRIDLAVDRFLADLAPLQSGLDSAVNGFFGEIREATLLLHPASLKDAVSSVYTTLREKLDVLDPDELAAELRTSIWDPLIDPLKAIDPAAIQVQLDALYQQLIDKLAASLHGLIAQLEQAIDVFLGKVRAALKLVLDALRVQLEAILADVTALLGQVDQLIVNDLLGRLLTLLANLQVSFDRELDRVRNEFDAMLDAIPLGSSASATASI